MASYSWSKTNARLANLILTSISRCSLHAGLSFLVMTSCPPLLRVVTSIRTPSDRMTLPASP
jgi:hypothetical protein